MSQSSFNLYIDASERRFTAAVSLDGKVESGRIDSPKRTLEDMLPLMAELCSRFDRKLKDLDGVYVTMGPGSNTGLRMAITFARMIFSLSLGRTQIYGASTFDVLRAGSGLKDCLCLISDRHGEFFYAEYRYGKRVSTGKFKDFMDRPFKGLIPVFDSADLLAEKAFPEGVSLNLADALTKAEAYECYSPDRIQELKPIYSEKI